MQNISFCEARDPSALLQPSFVAAFDPEGAVAALVEVLIGTFVHALVDLFCSDRTCACA